MLASYQPVAGVVALATPHHPPKDPRLPFIKPISLLRRFKPKGPPRWRDAAAAVDHVSYSSDPTRAYAEARDLMAIMRQSLPQITAPVLLIYSKDDPTITSEERHAEQILEGIGSRDKELVWVENSGHVILRDAARELAFHAIGDFIQKVTKGQA
jgi:carboxylesterase